MALVDRYLLAHASPVCEQDSLDPARLAQVPRPATVAPKPETSHQPWGSVVTHSVAALLNAHGLHPRKRLGQNFLTDPVALERIVATADLSPDDVVVEVGAGVGTLTHPLAERAGQVFALELDDRLVGLLHAELADLPNVEIVHGDALHFSTGRFPHLGYKVVANLPYYISTAIIQRLIACRGTFTSLTLMLQKEVAERIAAAPGGKEYGFLSVLVQYHTIPRVEFLVPPGAFTPRPKVDSAVVTLQVRERPAVPVADETLFVQVIKAAFGQRRKTLRNSLGTLGIARDAMEVVQRMSGIDLGRRAETLSLAEFAALSDAIGRKNRGKEYT